MRLDKKAGQEAARDGQARAPAALGGGNYSILRKCEERPDAEQVLKRKHGLITNLLVGIAGALLGGFLANALGIGFGGFIGSLIVSTLGAILFLVILGAIRRRA